MEPAHIIFLKALTLSLRVSPSVYEGVSGNLVCGTKVPTPIRSLLCNAPLLAAWSGTWFPCATSMLRFWCPLQWKAETSAGRWTASKSLKDLITIFDWGPLGGQWPLSFQIARCACSNIKACLESVQMTTLSPFSCFKARVSAMSSANWAEVPGGKGLASMVSKLVTTAYLALLLPSKTNLFPSMYQISSGICQRIFWQSLSGFYPVVQGF